MIGDLDMKNDFVDQCPWDTPYFIESRNLIQLLETAAILGFKEATVNVNEKWGDHYRELYEYETDFDLTEPSVAVSDALRFSKGVPNDRFLSVDVDEPTFVDSIELPFSIELQALNALNHDPRIAHRPTTRFWKLHESIEPFRLPITFGLWLPATTAHEYADDVLRSGGRIFAMDQAIPTYPRLIRIMEKGQKSPNPRIQSYSYDEVHRFIDQAHSWNCIRLSNTLMNETWAVSDAFPDCSRT